MILIKNAQVYSPAPLGQKDVLVSFDRILQIADHIDTPYTDTAGNRDTGTTEPDS